MSVRTDIVNLIVNVNGNKAKSELNDLQKKASDTKLEMKGLTKGTDEFLKKEAELKQITGRMTELKKQIGLTSLSQKELNQELNKLKSLKGSVSPLSQEYKEYDAQMQKVVARQKELAGGSAAVSSSMLSVSGAIKGFGVMVAAQFTLQAISGFFSGAVEEAEQAERSVSRLRNTLENIGRADVFERLSVQADDLAESFKHLDNDDILEVFQQLIVYGKLTEKQLSELLPVIIDFAAHSGGSLTESASLFVKSLEGNARAMKEYGIDMKEGKNVTERFGIIMDELAPKIRNAAYELGTTIPGQGAIARQEINNIKETIGKQLEPAIRGFYSIVRDILNGMSIVYNAAGNYIRSLTEEGRKQNALLAKQAELETLKAYAQNVVKDAAGQSIADQEKLLRKEEERLVNLKKLNEEENKAIETAKRRGMERRRSTEYLKNERDIELSSLKVAALKSQIVAAKDTRILGTGDPDDKPGKGSKTTKGKSEDVIKFEKLQAEAKQFEKELNNLRKQAELGQLSADEQEIKRVEIKYQELLDKATEFATAKVITKTEFDAQEVELERLKVQELLKLFNERTGKTAAAQYEQDLRLSEELYSKKRNQAGIDYANGVTDKQQYEQAINIIDADETQHRIDTAQNYNASVKKASDDLRSFRLKQEKDTTSGIITESEKRKQFIEDEGAASKRLELSKAKPGSKSYRDILKKDLLDELELKKKKWGEESAQYLDAKLETEKKIKKIDQEAALERIERIREDVQVVQDIMLSMHQFLSASEDRMLAKERKRNDEKKSLYKKQLDNKLMSQAQYDKKALQLEEDQRKKENEVRRKQAQREKALNIFNVIVNTAAAVAKTFAQFGFPLGIVPAAAMTLIGGLQVAAIAKQPLPELGSGDWIRKGPKHRDKERGIPVMIERDEAVIAANAMTDPTRYTVSGTTAQITSALNKKGGGVSWAGGAVVDMIQWRKERPVTINPGMPRIMEQGGVVRPVVPQNSNDNSKEIAQLLQINNELLEKNTEAIQTMKTKLHTVFSIKEFRETETRYENAKKVSSLNQ